MDQIDRIKSEGWLPDGFFDEEIICDFKVTKERKELWAVILDMYNDIQRSTNILN